MADKKKDEASDKHSKEDEPFIDSGSRPDLSIDLDKKLSDLTLGDLKKLLSTMGTKDNINIPVSIIATVKVGKEVKDFKENKDNKDRKAQKDGPDRKRWADRKNINDAKIETDQKTAQDELDKKVEKESEDRKQDQDRRDSKELSDSLLSGLLTQSVGSDFGDLISKILQHSKQGEPKTNSEKPNKEEGKKESPEQE